MFHVFGAPVSSTERFRRCTTLLSWKGRRLTHPGMIGTSPSSSWWEVTLSSAAGTRQRPRAARAWGFSIPPSKAPFYKRSG
eukprot:2036255-Amphidinium_carterae.1